ncbi:metallophosphoesterase [Guyparkeria sp.]|uniref:metallophosphoesterase n=1 Tax=Guyparkeria sp. TaxID=2035736 RepID=UPI0035617EE5
MTLFKQLLKNTRGRDFIVGDLHGSRPLLEKILEKHDFSPEHDRVIAVGDLLDYGEDSLGTLRLLGEPWFFSVAGNHERVLANHRLPLVERSLTEGQRSDLEAMGCGWLLEPYDKLKDDKWDDLITEVMNLISQMPLMIQVGNGPAAVGVVHAELPLWDWDQNIARLERVKKLTYWGGEAGDPQLDTLLWGRSQVTDVIDGRKMERHIRGIDWVIAGHTIVDQPVRAGNRLWIDSGAWDERPGRGLTLVEVGDTLTVSSHYHDPSVRTQRFVRRGHHFHSVIGATG